MARPQALAMGRMRRSVLFVLASFSWCIAAFCFKQSMMKLRYWDPIMKWAIPDEYSHRAPHLRSFTEDQIPVFYYHILISLVCFQKLKPPLKFSSRVAKWISDTIFLCVCVILHGYIENFYDVVVWFSLCFHGITMSKLVTGYSPKNWIYYCLSPFLLEIVVHYYKGFGIVAVLIICGLYQGVRHLDAWCDQLPYVDGALIQEMDLFKYGRGSDDYSDLMLAMYGSITMQLGLTMFDIVSRLLGSSLSPLIPCFCIYSVAIVLISKKVV